jgi:hypothetical protein
MANSQIKDLTTEQTTAQSSDRFVIQDGASDVTKRMTMATATTYMDKALHPYMFLAYRATSTQAIGATAFTKILCQTELYDRGSAYDSVTNFRFTAPVAGYYQFNARAESTTGGTTEVYILSLYVNGVEYVRGDHKTSGATPIGIVLAPPPILLAATDYVELYIYNGSGAPKAVNFSSAANALIGTYFGGRLVTTP